MNIVTIRLSTGKILESAPFDEMNKETVIDAARGNMENAGIGESEYELRELTDAERDALLLPSVD